MEATCKQLGSTKDETKVFTDKRSFRIILKYFLHSQILFVAVCALLAQQAFGHLVGRGFCPVVPFPYPSFDPVAYSGDWYLQQINLELGVIVDCVIYNVATNLVLSDWPIVFTDYTSYSVNFNCVWIELLDINFQTAFILTRDRHPSQAVLDLAITAFSDNLVININTLLVSDC